MKILAFNINRSNQGKISKILSLAADIMVLPECASQSQIMLPDDYEMEWMGIPEWCNWKGLGVIWRKDHEVVVAPWYNDEYKYILPLIVDRKFILIAAWPTLVPDVKKTYPQILLESLREYKDYISNYPTLICGDFNCYIGQSCVAKKTGTFEQCIEFMNSIGLYSLYHERTGEDFGKESKPTFYYRFKEDAPFFIDYAFTNINVFAYEIGKWDKDISDHCPQMIVL